MEAVRILRPCRFLGPRNPGEVIPAERLRGVSPAVIAANEASGILEVLRTDPQAEAIARLRATVEEMAQRIEALEARTAALEAEEPADESSGRGRRPASARPDSSGAKN